MSSPRLLDQVRDRLRVKHDSMRTEPAPILAFPRTRGKETEVRINLAICNTVVLALPRQGGGNRVF
jgi:hypothetical protein